MPHPACTTEECDIDGQTPDVSVLIVDDQAPFRSAARTVVSIAPGFVVSGESDSGEAAVATAADLHPDLVLMDINLPGINGVEATRQILAEHPDTIVILLSTYTENDLPSDARTCGAASYVHKEDFSPAVVRSVWDEHRPVS
jgi:DNA-binding NarL/FixJ family response regulator